MLSGNLAHLTSAWAEAREGQRSASARQLDTALPRSAKRIPRAFVVQAEEAARKHSEEATSADRALRERMASSGSDLRAATAHQRTAGPAQFVASRISRSIWLARSEGMYRARVQTRLLQLLRCLQWWGIGFGG